LYADIVMMMMMMMMTTIMMMMTTIAIMELWYQEIRGKMNI